MEQKRLTRSLSSQVSYENNFSLHEREGDLYRSKLGINPSDYENFIFFILSLSLSLSLQLDNAGGLSYNEMSIGVGSNTI